MRIRKHAKNSPLVYAASSLNPDTVIQTHVCQLNQSPWDVMAFSSSDPETPPPPLVYDQVDGDDDYMANRNFADCIAADQSAPSMKFEVGNEMQKWDHDVGIPPAERSDNGGTEMEQEVHKGGEITPCCKSDGKRWQCRRKAKEGHTLCEHHSSGQVNIKTNNSAHSAAAKKSEKPSESRRRPRPKKPTLSSNPYEYYYYSGFGPRWGKKRGPATTRAEPYTSSGTGSEASRNDVELVAEPNTPETNIINAPVEESFPISPRFSQMEIEGFDYIEDEEEEEEDEEDEIGLTEKKRARKPIKARSLKSLM